MKTFEKGGKETDISFLVMSNADTGSGSYCVGTTKLQYAEANCLLSHIT